MASEVAIGDVDSGDNMQTHDNTGDATENSKASSDEMRDEEGWGPTDDVEGAQDTENDPNDNDEVLSMNINISE